MNRIAHLDLEEQSQKQFNFRAIQLFPKTTIATERKESSPLGRFRDGEVLLKKRRNHLVEKQDYRLQWLAVLLRINNEKVQISRLLSRHIVRKLCHQYKQFLRLYGLFLLTSSQFLLRVVKIVRREVQYRLTSESLRLERENWPHSQKICKQEKKFALFS